MESRREVLGKTEETILANPFRCRMWSLHDRLEEYLTEQTCKAEIESFGKNGQLVAVLGRQLHGDSEYDIELIYGARRLYVARHLNASLLVRIRALSDREALVAMDTENRLRKDISPYERGLSYLRWLRSGQFKNQDEIAHTLRVSPSMVSRLLKIGRLPSVIVSSFQSPMEIQEGWGLKLAEAWNDPMRRPTLLRRARNLAARPTRLAAREVFDYLLSEHITRSARPARQVEVVRNPSGRALFKVARQRRAVVLSLPAAAVSNDLVSEIKRAVADILQRDPKSAGVDQTPDEVGTSREEHVWHSPGPVHRALPELQPRFAAHCGEAGETLS